MGYAVVLYFDQQTEQGVLDLRDVLENHGVSSMLGRLGDRPHISLAVFDDVDRDLLISVAQDHSGTLAAFGLQLSAVGTFPTNENTVFLSPVPTIELLQCHQELHRRLATSGLLPSPYYLPANWVPHCTVEQNIPDEQVTRAIQLCKDAFKPLTGAFQEIGVVEFRPVKYLANWPLSESKRGNISTS